jgi:hypothetical protein
MLQLARAMPKEHTIKQGECIFSIATVYGHKWDTIWNAPENQSLRKDRDQPGVLMPGDRVSIPDLQPKVLTLATNKRHKIIVALNLVTMRVRLMEPPAPAKEDPTGGTASNDHKDFTIDDPEPPDRAPDQPRANVPFEVWTEGKMLLGGNSDGDGYIEFKLRPEVTEAELICEPRTLKELRMPLALGGLDPISTVRGVKQRLYNLGLDCGDTSDDEHDNFAATVSAFQEAQGLRTTGELDADTRAHLQKVHGF